MSSRISRRLSLIATVIIATVIGLGVLGLADFAQDHFGKLGRMVVLTVTAVALVTLPRVLKKRR